MDDEVSPTPEQIEGRKKWFQWYTEQLQNPSVVIEHHENVLHFCPCCGYKTLSERGGYIICSVCFWEDDGQDEEDADTVRGGPNGLLSLAQARENYREHGACEPRFIKHVRAPLPEEE